MDSLLERNAFNFEEYKSRLETCTSMPSLRQTEPPRSKNHSISQHLSISFLNSNVGANSKKKPGSSTTTPKSTIAKPALTL